MATDGQNKASTTAQQLMGRGTARIIDNGEAKDSVLHLWHKDCPTAVKNPTTGVEDDLVQRAFPGIVYELRRGFVGEVVDELVEILSDTPGKTKKLSIAAWTKKSVKYQELTHNDQTANARDEAVRIVRDTRMRDGRSLVRVPL